MIDSNWYYIYIPNDINNSSKKAFIYMSISAIEYYNYVIMAKSDEYYGYNIIKLDLKNKKAFLSNDTTLLYDVPDKNLSVLVKTDDVKIFYNKMCKLQLIEKLDQLINE